MVETPFDYPRLRRGTMWYKSSVGWCEAEIVVRVADSCEQHSSFRAGDRLNAVEEAPTDTLLARFLIRISVLSIARGRKYSASPRCFFTRKTDELTVYGEETEATRESDSQLPLNVYSH